MAFVKIPSRVASAINKKKRWKKRPKPYNAPKSEDLDIILGRWKVAMLCLAGAEV